MSAAASQSLPRALRAVRRHGLRGVAQRLHAWVLRPLAARLYLAEEHVWYEIPDVGDAMTLPDGYALRRGTAADLPAVAAMGGVSPDTGRAYLEGGAEMYAVTRDGELAFSSWVHPHRVPVLAAPGGLLELPDGVVCVEDSLTAREHRGAGVAGPAINRMIREQHERGASAVITKIAVDNAPARRVMTKMRAPEVAHMRLRRIGPWTRVRIEPSAGQERLGGLLASRMAR